MLCSKGTEVFVGACHCLAVAKGDSDSEYLPIWHSYKAADAAFGSHHIVAATFAGKLATASFKLVTLVVYSKGPADQQRPF